jgi:hypothetical protein
MKGEREVPNVALDFGEFSIVDATFFSFVQLRFSVRE